MTKPTPTAQPSASQAQTLPPYAELFCLSNFSFLQGASHAEELRERIETATKGLLEATKT